MRVLTRLLSLLALLALLPAGCDGPADDAPATDGADDPFSPDGKADGLGLDRCTQANVLARVNRLDLDAEGLRADGVHSRAAQNLVTFRAGPDGVVGTGDDRRFRDLQAVDDVPWVGPAALRQLVDAAGSQCRGAQRYEVVLTAPYCDVCDADDKAVLVARSPMTRRVVELIDGARETVDAAQFTFSVKAIEDALQRAHARGVKVRVAIDGGQDRDGSVARRLRDAGLAVRFVRGKNNGSYAGLQHAKFLLVDDTTLLTGSNNWSSTGTSINEESAVVVHADKADPLRAGFACHFEAMWADRPDDASACSVDGLVGFTPGGGAIDLIEDALAEATTRVDVLMHHLVFDTLQKRLAQAAERGVSVRIVINAEDRDELRGRYVDRIVAAGGQIRYKQTNAEAYQLMHHKLVIVDDRVLVNGSGNWSGSAFFNNYENYVRYDDPAAVEPFVDLYARLWQWSLTADSLDAGLTAAQQDAARTKTYFGNLHAHIHAGGGALDDGHPEVLDDHGNPEHVEVGETPAKAARFAFGVAQASGMDFMALSPHVTGADDPNAEANMTPDAYAEIVGAAEAATLAANGAFVAIPAMEWSTNSAGNHVNVMGTRTLAKVDTGAFDRLYDEFVKDRRAEGERPLVMFNHPRTFRHNEEFLNGSWDQIFGVRLSDLPKASEAKKKFNDYGLDDYAPLRDVLEDWIAGTAMPDEALVSATLRNVAAATADTARLMEVTVARGTELGGHTPVNPSLSVDPETGEVSRFVKTHSDWDHYLLHGFRLAPAANHDNHRANWGYGHTTRTAVQAEALTEEALLGAVREARAYATEDPNLEIAFYAGDRVPMGGRLGVRGARATGVFRLVDPDAPGDWVVTVWRGEVGGKAVEAVATFDGVPGGDWQGVALDVPAVGGWFFYLEVWQKDTDVMAWTAPVWVERVE